MSSFLGPLLPSFVSPPRRSLYDCVDGLWSMVNRLFSCAVQFTAELLTRLFKSATPGFVSHGSESQGWRPASLGLFMWKCERHISPCAPGRGMTALSDYGHPAACIFGSDLKVTLVHNSLCYFYPRLQALMSNLSLQGITDASELNPEMR